MLMVVLAMLTLPTAVKAAPEGDEGPQQTIEVKVQQPWGWQNATSVAFGNVCIGFASTKDLQVNVSDMTLDVTAESSHPAFSATLVKGESSWTLTVSVVATEEGALSGQLTVASGDASVTLDLTANGQDLSAPTLAELKTKATAYNTTYYYTGSAVVSHVEGTYVFLEDESGAAVVSPGSGTLDLMPGDVVSFNAKANSPGTAWKSFMQASFTRAETFNWQAPKLTRKTALDSGDYGRLVNVSRVKYDETVGSNYFLFKNDDGETFTVHAAASSNPYNEELQVDADTYYDIIGAVYSYNRNYAEPYPHVTPVEIRPSEPTVTLNDLYTVAGTTVDGTAAEQKCTVAVDASDNYKYWFDGLMTDQGGQAVKVYGVLSADGTTLHIPTGQQLFNTSTTTDDAFFGAYDTFTTTDAAPLRKGTVVEATVGEDGVITLPKSIAAVHHNGEADSWSCTGGLQENATLTPLVYTHTLDVRVQKPWGWVAGNSLEYGSVCTGHPSVLQARVYSSDMDAEVAAESDDPAFVPVLTKGDEFWELTVTALSDEVADKTATLTISSEGAEEKTVALTASFKDLSASTLAELKEKATQYNVRYYYTGEAIVSHVEGLYMFVEDETDAAVITMPMGYTDDIVAGDVIRFSADANSPSYEWKSFMHPTIEHVEYFNWREPICTPVEKLTAADYGKLVRIKNVKFDHQDVTGYYGTVTYYTVFKNDAGEEFTLREVSENNPFYGTKDYDADTYYDIIGAVYSYNQTQAPPTPHVTPLNIRPSEPVRTLETGDYQGAGYYILWGKSGIVKYMCNISQDEEDPYKYWFDNIIMDYNGFTPRVYGILSNDGNSISLPTGQQLYNTSSSTDDIFFGAYDEFPDAQKVAPWRKGTIATASIDEDGMITFPMSIVIAHYNESFEGTEYDNLTWGYWGGFYAGLTMKKYLPMPTVTDWTAEANGMNAVISWNAPTEDNGYEILGYGIQRDGELIAECDSETFSFTDTNLKEGTYSYAIFIVTQDGESDLSDVKQVTISIPTGVQEFTSSDAHDATIYSVGGSRMDGGIGSLKKGVYVVNGRKIVIR